jgi:hypothetical protein
MKKQLFVLSLAMLLGGTLGVFAQDNKEIDPKLTEDWTHKPEVVSSDKYGESPSDAIVLYGGKTDLNKWVDGNGKNIAWKAKGKALIVEQNGGMITSKKSFGDMQLHIEWASPKKAVGKGQQRGNSGIFIMGLYEIQVLDSYNNETYYNGQAGSVYKQHAPLVNACRKSGKWQTYDIFFTAPKFDSYKKLISPAYATVVHNGILIQNHVEVKGPTEYRGQPVYKYHESKLPIQLQDHGNPVKFKNIWVREL